MKVNGSGLAPLRNYAEPDGPVWAGPAVAGFDPSRPNIARVYDFLLGGKDHFPADRLEAERLLGIYPHLAHRIRENRLFLRRAVHWLATERGISQFLDIGSGLPAAANTHEIAQAANPGCRIAYVDNDPMVVAHARALLASGPGVIAVHADAADPAAIMADPDITGLITQARPCAVILAMMLHFFDLGTARRIVTGFAAQIAPGSYLVISVGSGDKRTGGALADGYRAHRLYNHSQDAIRTLFAGLEVVDPPGLADARHWQPGEPAPVPSRTGGHVLAAVARTPPDAHLIPLPPGSAKAGHQLAKADPASAAFPWNERQFKYACPIAQMAGGRIRGRHVDAGRRLRLPGPGPGIRTRTRETPPGRRGGAGHR